MPHRDRLQIERWLEDFIETRPDLARRLSVVDRDFAPAPDSAVVIFQLQDAPTLTYLHPVANDGVVVWEAVLERRDTPVSLNFGGLRQLASDVNDIAAVCDYLQERTDRAV